MSAVQVRSGAPTLIALGVQNSAVIINNDPVNAVWLSSDASITPGAGTFLAPLANLSWAGSDQVYACLDTSNTIPVTINLSTDITAIDNPVAVGAAVAAQLLATGIPSVLIGTAIITNGATLPVNLNVSGYASLQFTAYVSKQGPFVIYFTDNAGGTLASWTVNAGQPGAFINITIPVMGPNLTINFNFSGICSLIHLYGSNRAADFAVTNQTPTISFTPNQAWVVNQNLVLGYFTSNGGPIWCRMLVTGTGKGYFAYYDYTQTGSAVIMRVQATTALAAGPTGAPEVYQVIYLPPGVYEMVYQSQIAASYQVIWELTQP